LRHFITQLNFKLSTVQAALATDAGNIEFALLLFGTLFDEGGRSKDETEFIDLLELFLQLFKGVHGKAGRSNGYTASPFDGDRKIITNNIMYVVEDFHIISPPACCFC